MSLSEKQREKARRRLATKRWVPESSITNDAIQNALASGELTMSECGSSGHTVSGGDYGSSSSSSWSSDCGGSSSW